MVTSAILATQLERMPTWFLGHPRVLTRCAAVAVLFLGLAACQDEPSADRSQPGAEPSVAAEMIQLRRDQVLQRVEVAVRNTGSSALMVERLRLRVAGFDLPGALRKDEPIPAGQVVNLPVPFTGVDCPTDGPPRIGPARVTLQVRQGDEAATRTVRLTADDGDGLLLRIATRACAVERVRREVDLRLSDEWRLERTPDGDVLHGELVVRLLGTGPRTVTEVAGTVLYGLRPEAQPPPVRLTVVSTARPEARVPVLAYANRCTGHAMGEIKKPYEFLVWVSEPGEEEIAVTPAIGDGTKAALRQVCAF